MGFGDTLQRLRKRMGMTRRTLAQRTRVPIGIVTEAEAGQDMPVSQLQSMAAGLGCQLLLVPHAMTLALQARIETEWAQPLAPTEAENASQSEQALPLASSYEREWPSVDPEVFLLIAYLERAALLINRGLEKLAASHNMTVGEILVLGALRRLGPPYESTMSRLQRHFWISLPGMLKRVGNLEERGYVERMENPSDKRGHLIRLTQKGFGVQDMYVQNPTPEFAAIKAMSAQERSRFVASLAGLLRAFGEKPSA